MSRSADPFRARPTRDDGDDSTAVEAPDSQGGSVQRDDQGGLSAPSDVVDPGGFGGAAADGDTSSSDGDSDAGKTEGDVADAEADAYEAADAADDQVEQDPIPSKTHLEGMRKADLQALCAHHNVDYAADDTRPELIDRLDKARD